MNKRVLRKLMNSTIDMYNTTKDPKYRLKLAILKGLYISMGGRQGIPLPPIYNSITRACIIVYRYSNEKDYYKQIEEALNILADTYEDDLVINRRSILDAIDNIMVDLQVG